MHQDAVTTPALWFGLRRLCQQVCCLIKQPMCTLHGDIGRLGEPFGAACMTTYQRLHSCCRYRSWRCLGEGTMGVGLGNLGIKSPHLTCWHMQHVYQKRAVQCCMNPLSPGTTRHYGRFEQQCGQHLRARRGGDRTKSFPLTPVCADRQSQHVYQTGAVHCCIDPISLCTNAVSSSSVCSSVSRGTGTLLSSCLQCRV